MIYDLLKEKSCPNLPGPTWKMNCPLLLNHERTVISHIILESWVKFHLITARPVESRNHLNRACQSESESEACLKSNTSCHDINKFKNRWEKKLVDMYQSGKGYEAPF